MLNSKSVTFAHDREKYVGASEIGQCIKKSAYKKLGIEKDPGHTDDLGFAQRGNLLEDHFAAPMMHMAVKAAGGELLWAGQENQTTLTIDSWRMSCTPDGLAVGVSKLALAAYGVMDCGESFLVEFKSADPRLKLDVPKPPHAQQVNYGLGIVRADGEYNPSHGLLLYTDCSSLQLKPFVLAFNKDLFKAQKARAARIMDCTNPDQLPPEGKLAGGKECKYCEWSLRCKGKLS